MNCELTQAIELSEKLSASVSKDRATIKNKYFHILLRLAFLFALTAFFQSTSASSIAKESWHFYVYCFEITLFMTCILSMWFTYKDIRNVMIQTKLDLSRLHKLLTLTGELFDLNRSGIEAKSSTMTATTLALLELRMRGISFS
jgi:hypothetical protein